MKRWLGCGVTAAIIVLVGLLLGGWAMRTYNGLVRKELQVDEAWSQVENQYQRRSDLIPNLMETVKGVAEFEKSTYTAVAEARAKVSQIVVTPQILDDPARFKQFQQSQGELGSALTRLLATVENYPDLKASENFREFQSQLEGAENRIAVERRRFNETVRAFNEGTRVFPASLLAGMFGFSQKAFFEADAGSEKAPKVQF